MRDENMQTIHLSPQKDQVEQFIQACREGPSTARQTLFTSLLALDGDEPADLIDNGMLPWDAPWEEIQIIWQRLAKLEIGSRIRETLMSLCHDYPAPSQDLFVRLFPMAENDRFGRERLGGVSAWVNWEGNTMHFIVYPSPDTFRTLKSTVVHEYHHHYRIAITNNKSGHINLLESLVREGMAEHLVQAVLGPRALAPWATSLSEQEAWQWWNKVYSQHVDEKGSQAATYIFGGKDAGIPLWAGYSVGYYLIKWYRHTHPEITIPELTALDGPEFIPLSRPEHL